MTYSKPTEGPHESSPATPDCDNENLIVNTVVYDELYIPAKVDLETFAKTHLRNESENSTLDSIGNGFVFGNARGFSLMERMEKMDRDILILKHETRTLRIELESERSERKSEVTSLEGRVGQLAQHAESYLQVRKRFLRTYERDVKDTYTHKGALAVQLGNARAHQGDALADATVFDQDNQFDTALYRELYGFDYTKIIELHNAAVDDGGIFKVINTHATLLSQGKALSHALKEAFENFVTEAEQVWLQPPDDDPKTPLRRAYWKFFRELDENEK